MRLRRSFPLLLVASLVARGASAQFTWSSPAARVAGWREDLDSAVTAFLPRDRSFDPWHGARFRYAVAALRDSVPMLTDAELTVRLATAVAGAGNGHTRLYLLRNRTSLRRYPIRVWWFGKELVIVRATPEHADLLGARIATIAGRPVAELARRVAPLYAGSASWERYLSTYLLTSPEILEGIGALTGDTLPLTVTTGAGAPLAVMLAPEPFVRSDAPREAWWDLAPSGATSPGEWRSLLPGDSLRLPLYLRHLDRYYWAARVPAQAMVYLQYTRAQDQPGGTSVGAFGDSLVASLEHDPPSRLVIDLRFNTGGDLSLAEPFLRRIAALPLAQARGRLFIITGRATFSAGISAVALLRQFTRAVIVGEPVGDGLDFWAEGGNILLPNTRLTLHYANGFHRYSTREYPEARPYYYQLSVHDLGPDHAVESSLGQYLAGEDPALEWVLRQH